MPAVFHSNCAINGLQEGAQRGVCHTVVPMGSLGTLRSKCTIFSCFFKMLVVIV